MNYRKNNKPGLISSGHKTGIPEGLFKLITLKN